MKSRSPWAAIGLSLLLALLAVSCGGDPLWDTAKYWAVRLDSPRLMEASLERSPSVRFDSGDEEGNWADFAVREGTPRVLRFLYLRGIYPQPLRSGKGGATLFDLLLADDPLSDAELLAGLVHYDLQGFPVGGFSAGGTPLVELCLGWGYGESARFILARGGRIDPRELMGRIVSGIGITDATLAAVLAFHYDGTPVFGRDYQPDHPFLTACLEAGFTESAAILLERFPDFPAGAIPWEKVVKNAGEEFYLALLREDRRHLLVLRNTEADGTPLPLILLEKGAYRALERYVSFFPDIRNEGFGGLPLFGLYGRRLLDMGASPDPRLAELLYPESWENRLGREYRAVLLGLFPRLTAWNLRERLFPLLEGDLVPDGVPRDGIRETARSGVYALALVPDGRVIFAERDTGLVEGRDARYGAPLWQFPDREGPSGLVVDAGGRWLAHATPGPGSPRLVIRPLSRPLYPVYQELPVSGKWRLLCAGAGPGELFLADDDGILFWSVDRAEVLWRLVVPADETIVQAVAADPLRGIALTDDGRLWRFDMKSGRMIGTAELYPERLERIAVGGGGSLLAAAAVDPVSGPIFFLLDAHTLEVLDRRELYPDGNVTGEAVVTILAFSPSSNRLLAGHTGGEPSGIVLFRLEGDRVSERLLGFSPGGNGAASALFSPDGRMVYAASGVEGEGLSCRSTAFGDLLWDDR